MSDQAASAIVTREFKNLVGRKVAIVSKALQFVKQERDNLLTRHYYKYRMRKSF